jgi:GNAT superfamily N-acetyltransferase
MNAVIRPLTEGDLAVARHICCTAFGTFLGAPEPENFWADRDYVYGRFGAEHVASFAAELDGELVGSNFATRWGSVGFFGPITVRPDRQEQGIAKQLVDAVSTQLNEWNVRHARLFTFPHSALHLGLYQKFGFHARFLTAIMAAPAQRGGAAGSWARYSELAEADRRAAEAACREVTEALYEGLDLGAEIRTVAARALGDTLCCGLVRPALPVSQSVIGDQQARPAPAIVSSNLARCGRGPPQRAISTGSSTLVPRSPSGSACQTC